MSRIRLRKRRQRSRAAASSKKFRLVMSCIERLSRTACQFDRIPQRSGPLPARPAALAARNPLAAAARLRAKLARKSRPTSEPNRPTDGGSSRRLLNDGPVVIAGIAGRLEHLDPAVRIVVELGG